MMLRAKLRLFSDSYTSNVSKHKFYDSECSGQHTIQGICSITGLLNNAYSARGELLQIRAMLKSSFLKYYVITVLKSSFLEALCQVSKLVHTCVPFSRACVYSALHDVVWFLSEVKWQSFMSGVPASSCFELSKTMSSENIRHISSKHVRASQFHI